MERTHKLKEIEEAIDKIVKEEGIEREDVKVVSSSVVPMRLQHIFRDLGKEGYVVKESLVVNGELYLIAVRKGERLDIAPDFEKRDE